MKTQIIATIGPATLDKKIFKQTIDAGVDIIRINTAYGNFAQYDQILDNLKETKKDIKVLFDIKKTDVLDYFNKHGLDYVAVSFAYSAKQLTDIKKISPGAKIIAKIESKPGVSNFKEILDNSDGVMVARGDLGEAVSLEKVPCLQKKFTRLASKNKKYVIAATEMLLSMQNNKTPTRAEVSDVANAVFDGVDAVMLSEETAVGKYPVESVTFMKKIIIEAENCDWD
jgi:pyruvate kinase